MGHEPTSTMRFVMVQSSLLPGVVATPPFHHPRRYSRYSLRPMLPSQSRVPKSLPSNCMLRLLPTVTDGGVTDAVYHGQYCLGSIRRSKHNCDCCDIYRDQ